MIGTDTIRNIALFNRKEIDNDPVIQTKKQSILVRTYPN